MQYEQSELFRYDEPMKAKVEPEPIGDNVLRWGNNVYRVDKTFHEEESADAYARLLDDRLSGKTAIATTATTARVTDNPSLPVVHDLLMGDLVKRRDHGIRKYKVPLRPFDGNDPEVEIYQELLDAVLYFRQKIYENYGR